MNILKHECGCRSERGTGRERWVSMCDTHRAETTETHLRWKQEREQSIGQATLAVSPL